LSTKRAYFLVLSAILTVPFALYLGGSPRFQIVGFFVPALFLGAAYCMKRRVYWLAWLLLLPYVSLIGWLGKAVMEQ
jgi:hypothetical protein